MTSTVKVNKSIENCRKSSTFTLRKFIAVRQQQFTKYKVPIGLANLQARVDRSIMGLEKSTGDTQCQKVPCFLLFC